MMRQAEALAGLNMDYVLPVSTSLSSHDSWISTYKAVLFEMNDTIPNDNVGTEFAQVSKQTHGSIVGAAPPPAGK